MAAISGQASAASALLEAGAAVDARNMDGRGRPGERCFLGEEGLFVGFGLFELLKLFVCATDFTQCSWKLIFLKLGWNLAPQNHQPIVL